MAITQTVRSNRFLCVPASSCLRSHVHSRLRHRRPQRQLRRRSASFPPPLLCPRPFLPSPLPSLSPPLPPSSLSSPPPSLPSPLLSCRQGATHDIAMPAGWTPSGPQVMTADATKDPFNNELIQDISLPLSTRTTALAPTPNIAPSAAFPWVVFRLST